jgi:hypothetical protein
MTTLEKEEFLFWKLKNKDVLANCHFIYYKETDKKVFFFFFKVVQFRVLENVC